MYFAYERKTKLHMWFKVTKNLGTLILQELLTMQ